MNTYNGRINEFVDWVEGINSYTGEDVTKGLQVSGGSIRQLLQDRLRTPFVLKEDPANNKYRMFSSEEAYQMWAKSPSDNAALELFNFVRPSDYKLIFTGLNNSNKYIRLGDSTSADARISFSWSISNDEGLSSENLQVTYTITNRSIGKINTFTRSYNSGQNIDFSIYDYLKPGENSVVISGIGMTNGARNSVNYTIVLLDLSVESSFRFYRKYTNGQQITIPCTFNRNDTSGTARIHYIIDAGKTNQHEWTSDVLATNDTRVNVDKLVQLDFEPGQHTLQIYADCSYNEGSVTIRTNLLYFTFVIATDEISAQKYICISTEFTSGIFPITNVTLQSTQYVQSTLRWGYYTESLSQDSKITVQWKLYESDEDQNPILLSTLTANSQVESADLQFIPTIYSQYDQSSNPTSFLSAQYNDTEILRIPIQITQNPIAVSETGLYDFKLSAYGRTNNGSNRNEWSYGDASTTFTGIQWNQNSGWYKNSFRTKGTSEYATIDYCPFKDFGFDSTTHNLQGNYYVKTIEIEFETEKVNNDNDVLIRIGNPSGGRIEITPVKASLFSNSNKEVICTNYKSNERLKLAFIINDVPYNSDNITKESGLVYIVNNGILERASNASDQNFISANTSANIKIGGSNSGVRVYNMRIYNYALTYTQAYNNFLYDSDDKAAIFSRNDILGSGNTIDYLECKNRIDTILISGDLSNILNQNATKDDSLSEVTIERTCPYDTTKNFKINNARIRKHGQSTLNYPISSMKIWFNKSNSSTIPTFEITPQDSQQFGKNRYRMKNESIPSNKFVLQANYADSSGVHNGGLQRLIQNSWYNAQINGKYLLRTEPQLFTSISSSDKSAYGLSSVWADYIETPFPYEVRVSPDSFPCVVFYQNTGDDTQTFLGQYVFMDDKKSDYIYGERSIYRVAQDPFCLTVAHAQDDNKSNRIWDNGSVLRIEVIDSNSVYSSYMSPIDENTVIDIVDPDTNNVIGQRYQWEEAFEMIYPDPDDLNLDATDGTGKFGSDSKFKKKAKNFVDWYNWIVSTRNNQSKFEAEAADHLDLYKMAAYYIFALRFGLVDSLERNAQIKTYDGIHFHYEPWDMDIALGNKNDGGIAYNPPIDRNTLFPNSISTYAYSGRSGDADTGDIVTSNWLWDALEAWPFWQGIVKTVADALYNAGLTYDNACDMFDNVYASAWCETIYNKSGDFKYIQSRDHDKYLNWLQGSRITHRHWWLSTSMDYYDAKWFCGDYKQHSLYITANVSLGSNPAQEGETGIIGENQSGKIIRITPNKSVYITVQKDNKTLSSQGTNQVDPEHPLELNVPVMNTKNPFHIYGANYMETVDFSEIATGLDTIYFSGAYSEVLGSPLKNINIGCPITLAGENTYTMTVSTNPGDKISGRAEAFQNLQTLNIRGQRPMSSIMNMTRTGNISSLQNFYSMGSGLLSFYSSESGNNFNTVELPDSVTTLSFNNSTWNDLQFWHCAISGSTGTCTLCPTIPSTITTIELNGTSCQNLNSINLIHDWIAAIDAADGDFSTYTFNADNINWGPSTVGENNLLTYDELSKLAQMQGSISGYVCLKKELSEGQEVQLTTQQLAQIKNWFGDSVFDRNSSGLIVDHILSNSYAQITLGGDVRVVNNEIYLNEGGRASLNATKFQLADSAAEGEWFVSYASVSDPSQVSDRIAQRGLSIIKASQSADGQAYLQTAESVDGGNYDIKIWYSNSGSQPSTIIVHVVGVTYPQNIAYLHNDVSTIVPRETSGALILSHINTITDLYLNLGQLSYTAHVRNVQYKITRENNVAIYNTQSGTLTKDLWNDVYLDVQNSNSVEGLRLSTPTSIQGDNNLYRYAIESIITFISGKTITVTYQIIVMDDPEIVTSMQQDLYNALNTRWNQKYGSNNTQSFYKSDLMLLDGGLEFTNSMTNMLTATRETLLKYLPLISSIDFNGAPMYNEFTPIGGTAVYMPDFSSMPELVTLDMSGTGFNGDIDLSVCNKLTTVDSTSTTSLNIMLPTNPIIQTISYGQPSKIIIENPTRLNMNNVSIEAAHGVEEFVVKNMPNNDGYKLFYKLMQSKML